MNKLIALTLLLCSAAFAAPPSLHRYQTIATALDYNKARSSSYTADRLVRISGQIMTHSLHSVDFCMQPTRNTYSCPDERLLLTFQQHTPDKLQDLHTPITVYGRYAGNTNGFVGETSTPIIRVDYFKIGKHWTPWPPRETTTTSAKRRSRSKSRSGEIPHIPAHVRGFAAPIEPQANKIRTLLAAGKRAKVNMLAANNPLVCTILGTFSAPDWQWAHECHGMTYLTDPDNAFIVPANSDPEHPRWALQEHGKPALYHIGVIYHFRLGTRNVLLWMRAKDIERRDGKPLPSP